MWLTTNMAINIYSMLLLFIIGFHSLKQREKASLQHKLFTMMLYITLFLLFVDLFSRTDGKPNTIYPLLNHVSNFIIFLLNPLLPSLWLLFVHNQVFQEERFSKRLLISLIIVFAVHTVMLILSQFFGWFYTIDSDNIYHRGPLFIFSASIPIAMLLMAFVLIVVNRERIVKQYYYSLLFFSVPPFLCIFMQVAIYGISFLLNSIVLSMFIVFLNIQNHSIHTDYLTGVYNRKKLQEYLNKQVYSSTETKTFSAILLDLDDFKSINDTYGHDMGDEALQISAKLLKSCLCSNDFIARLGGDEFCIVLNTSNSPTLEKIVRKINHCVERYNAYGKQPYKISFSMGYATYDYHSHMKAADFQICIDRLMYENKRLKKEAESTAPKPKKQHETNRKQKN